MKPFLVGVVMLFMAGAIMAANNSMPAIGPAEPTPNPGLTLEMLGDYVAPSWVHPALPAAPAVGGQAATNSGMAPNGWAAPSGWAAQLQPAQPGQAAYAEGQSQSVAVDPGWYGGVGVPGEGDDVWQDPYANYVVTQGPHGLGYGHYAVDLTAGKGVDILSPINGTVTAVYVDKYNNTVLIVENGRYRVLMMHGNYTVQVGQVLRVGDSLGTEWNNGYTLDGNGNLCAGRDCGYHTHLNIFDKVLNSNIDPFTLLTK